MNRPLVTIALCALLLPAAVFAAGCGDDDAKDAVTPAPSTPTAPPATGSGKEAPKSTTAIEIGDNFFKPAASTVKAGKEVTWTNTGQVPHTVTAKSGETFDSGVLQSGDTFKHTFKKAGTTAYVCSIHAEQKGTVTVN